MANFVHSLIVNLGGNLPRQARSYGRQLDRFAAAGSRSMQALGRATSAASRGLDRLGNRYVALATGAAGVGTLRFVGNLERRLNRLGVQANVSAGDIGTLKDRIFEVANAPDIRVDAAEIISAVEAIVEKTGDLQFARDNIESIGRAIQASGGSGAQIGALVSEFKKFGIVTREDVLANLDTLVKQGKAGAFTIANLAAQGERLVSAYAATGRVGPKAVQEMGAVLQVIRQGTGSAEQATTAFEAVLRTLQDADKIKLLTQRGIQIFEPGQPGVMRSVAAIMEDIVRATGGSAVALSSVFDAEAMRAFSAASAEYKRTGNIESLHRFLAIMGDGQAIIADSARIARDSTGAWQGMVTAFQQFADANLAQPLKDIADALNSIDPNRVQQIMKGLALAGGASIGLIAVSKVVRAGSTIAGAVRGMRGRGRSTGAGAGEAAAGMGSGMGIVNVRVINWPATYSRTMGVGPAKSGGRGGATRGGRMGRAMGRLGTAGGIMAALGVMDAVSSLTDSGLSVMQRLAGAGGGLAGAGGAFAGAKLGAAAGAFGGPLAPVTVPAGALIGGGIGYFAGDEVGQQLGKWIAEALGYGDDATEPQKSEVKLQVSFEGAPAGMRYRLESDPGVDARIDQGRTMTNWGP